MPRRYMLFTGILVLVVSAAGCASPRYAGLAERTGGSAALFGQFRAYDGHTGRPVSFGDIVRRCGGADVVLFGERHSDSVCNQLEAQLLQALAQQGRPIALAMEFFELDTQADLDAYLWGRLDEPAFRERTRQDRDYVLAHRPLIELCRAERIPVVAANAPRRLVRAFRTSGLDYDEFRTGLEAADQRWLPADNEYVTGPYEQRFLEMMAQHGPGTPPAMPATMPASMPATMPSALPAAMPRGMPGTMPATMPSTMPAAMPSGMRGAMPTTMPTSAPASAPTSELAAPEMPPASQPGGAMPPRLDPASFYRSQLLWDQAMAESLVNYRDRYPRQRIMLVVGGFHVEREGGTAIKFRERRPNDRVCTVAYRGTDDPQLAFDEEDRGAGDIVIFGVLPPPEEERPTSRPTTMPTTAPADTPPGMPSSAPAGMPPGMPPGAPPQMPRGMPPAAAGPTGALTSAPASGPTSRPE